MTEDKQQQLLDYILEPNATKLNQLLTSASVDVNHIYETYNRLREYNALQIICSEICDRKEEDITKFRTQYKQEYFKCIEILLNNNIDLRYKDPDYKAQAIDFVVLTGEKDILELVLQKYEERRMSIANIDLISSVVNFHRMEEDVAEDYLDIIKILLEKGVDVNTLDNDTGEPPIYQAASLRFKEVVKILCTEKDCEIDFDYYVDSAGKTARNFILKYKLYDGDLPDKNKCKYHLLFKYLKTRNTSEFVERFKMEQDNMSKDKKCSFLIRAVQLGADEIVEYMLQETENIFSDYMTLIDISCKKGYYKVLKVLLGETECRSYGIRFIKDIVCVNKSLDDKAKFIDHNECLRLLLTYKRMNLNRPDKFGNSVLQYAIKHKNFKMISLLLDEGASLIVPKLKQHDQCLVLDIDPHLIQNHFDSCVKTFYAEENVQKRTKRDDGKAPKYDYSINFTSVLPPRQYATLSADSVGHYQLLNNYYPEMSVFQDIASDSSYNFLLNHPLSLLFVALKWHRIRYYFYTDVLLHVILMILLNCYVFNRITTLYVFVFLVFAVVLIWEIFQIHIFRTQYLKIFESWLKLLLLTFTLGILVLHFFETADYSENVFIQIQAVTSLISIANFFFLIGNSPMFSTSVIMIKTIYMTLIRSFLTYSVLILAFTTSFFILFRESYSRYFRNYGLSLFKAILMSTGEYDSVSFQFQPLPVSYVIMVLFVFLISIGLLNLLTALAVSDIQNIKINAELFGHAIRITQVARIEAIFLKPRLIKLLSFLQSICLFPIDDMYTTVDIDSSEKTVEQISKGVTLMKLNDKILHILEARKKVFDDDISCR